MALPRITTPQYVLTIPSTGEEVKYRPFLVKEEKILLIALESENEKQIMVAVKNIIDNCLDGKVDIDSLAMFDIEYIFLQLRAKSKGEEIELEVECEKCKNPIGFVVNINEVKVDIGEGHSNEIKLSDDIGVVMKYPNLDMKANFNEDASEMENIFSSLVLCLDTIWDKDSTYPAKDHTQEELHDFFESLPEAEFEKIQNFFVTMPQLKHEVDIKCKHKVDKKPCGYKGKRVLEGLNSFFA